MCSKFCSAYTFLLLLQLKTELTSSYEFTRFLTLWTGLEQNLSSINLHVSLSKKCYFMLWTKEETREITGIALTYGAITLYCVFTIQWQQFSVCLFRNFLPGLPESEDGAVDECGADLQDAVVVVHTAADVSDCRPLLNARGTLRRVRPAHDLRHDQTARLPPQHTILRHCHVSPAGTYSSSSLTRSRRGP